MRGESEVTWGTACIGGIRVLNLAPRSQARELSSFLQTTTLAMGTGQRNEKRLGHSEAVEDGQLSVARSAGGLGLLLRSLQQVSFP
jgi:hypothetical protein